MTVGGELEKAKRPDAVRAVAILDAAKSLPFEARCDRKQQRKYNQGWGRAKADGRRAAGHWMANWASSQCLRVTNDLIPSAMFNSSERGD